MKLASRFCKRDEKTRHAEKCRNGEHRIFFKYFTLSLICSSTRAASPPVSLGVRCAENPSAIRYANFTSILFFRRFGASHVLPSLRASPAGAVRVSTVLAAGPGKVWRQRTACCLPRRLAVRPAHRLAPNISFNPDAAR